MSTNAQDLSAAADDLLEGIDAPPPGNGHAQAAPPSPHPTVVVNMPAATRAQRPPRTDAPPEPKSTAAMNKLFKPGEILKIFKLNDLGQPGYVTDIAVSDLLQVSPDLDRYIQRYLLPKHRAGSYLIEAYNAKGEVVRRETRPVLDPDPVVAGAPPVGDSAMQREFIGRMFDRVATLETAAKPKSIGETAAELASLRNLLGGTEDKKGGGSDLGQLLLLQQMMGGGGGQSAEIAKLTSEIRGLIAAASNTPAPVPMAMLPPPPDPGAAVAQVAATFKDLFVGMQPAPKESFGLKDVLALLGAVTPFLDRLLGGPKEQLAELRAELREQRQSLQTQLQNQPRRGIAEVAVEFQELANLNQRLFGGRSDESFWSFADKVMENLPTLIESVRGADKSGVREATGTEEQAPPPGFTEAMATLDEATDDPDVINAMMKALNLLYQDKHYRKVARQLLLLVRQGKKDDALAFLGKILESCVNKEMLSEAGAEKTVDAFTRHYEKVADLVKAQAAAATAPKAG